MTRAQPATTDPRIVVALNELQGLIAREYPAAQFDIFHGDDPEGVYLRATVDLDDTDPVLDTVLDQLSIFQVEQELPIHVVTTVPRERIAQRLQRLRTIGRSPRGRR